MYTLVAKAVARLRRWQDRQRVLNELYSMDDRSLADIGLQRSDIPAVLAAAANSDHPIGPRRAA